MYDFIDYFLPIFFFIFNKNNLFLIVNFILFEDLNCHNIFIFKEKLVDTRI